MAPPCWTTPEQKAWLLGRMSEFMQLQAEGKLPFFWPVVMEAWFKSFPEHALLNLPLPTDKNKPPLTPEELATLGVAIKARRKQIENWFRNHRKKIGAANGSAPSAATAAMLQRIFQQSAPKRQRAHKTVEIFQKRNPELIKEGLVEAGYDLVNGDLDSEGEDDWVDEGQDTPEAHSKRKKSKRMRLRTRVVNALWAEASAEEVAAVRKEVEEEKEKMQEEEKEKETREQGSSKSPAEIQEAIDSLDSVYAEVHKATYLASGWVGMSIFGGPNPRMGGDLTLKIVCFGETPGGNDFEASCGVDFNKNITQPFRDFLRSCFSEGDTAAYALPGQETAVDGRPVERIIPTPPAAEVEKPKKKSKSKSKAKSQTQSHSQSKASAAEKQLTRDEAEEDEDEGLLMDHSEHDDNSFAAPDHDDDSSNRDDPLASLLPAGMMSAAEAAALVERRGVVDPAVIDPQLLGLEASAARSPSLVARPAHPTPRPLFKGGATSASVVTTVPPPVVSPPVISPMSFITTPPITPAMPTSRPPVKPPPPAPKKAPAAPKVSSAAIPAKDAAAAEAAKVAKKPRGRPRKSSLTDITEQIVNTLPAPTPSTAAPEPPPLVFTSTNNNRARAQQAAAAEKAAAEKAAAEARAAQAAKGWTEHTVNGATVVTLKRSRKAAKLPDGSDVPRVGTRPQPRKPTLDASERALLARAAANKKAAAKAGTVKAGTKRKAAAAESKAAPSTKKRRV